MPPGYNFVADACEAPEAKSKIESVLRSLSGRPLTIRFDRPGTDRPRPEPIAVKIGQGRHRLRTTRSSGRSSNSSRPADPDRSRGAGRRLIPSRASDRDCPKIPFREVAVFNNLGKLADLMKNAGQDPRAGREGDRRRSRVEGTAGGGVVTARVNGRMELVSVKIEPKLLADGDVELLEDLVVAAVNQAQAKVPRGARRRSFQSMAGGLPIPGLSGLFRYRAASDAHLGRTRIDHAAGSLPDRRRRSADRRLRAAPRASAPSRPSGSRITS